MYNHYLARFSSLALQVIQIIAAFIMLFSSYMFFALLDYQGGFDGCLNIVIVQPLMGVFITIIALAILFMLGLPLRLNRYLAGWWATHSIIPMFGLVTGVLLLAISAILKMTHKPFNPNIALVGWLAIGFFVIHFPIRKRNNIKDIRNGNSG